MPRVSIRKLFVWVLAVASVALLALNLHQSLVAQGRYAGWYAQFTGPSGPSGPSGSGGRGHVGLVETVARGESAKGEAQDEDGESEEEPHPEVEKEDEAKEGNGSKADYNIEVLLGTQSPKLPRRRYDLRPLPADDVEVPPPERRPWYMNKDATVRPNNCPLDEETGRRKATLLPEEDTLSDRIVDQLMYFSPKGQIAEDLESSDVPLKKILLWNGVNSWGNIRPGRGVFLKEQCPVNSCAITSSRAEAASADLVIFKDHFTRPTYQRPDKQLWMIYMLECPLHTQMFKIKDVFNWTATYRSDSTIVAPYERWQYYNDNVRQIDQGKNYAANKTKAVAWFVSNCGARNGRLQYAKELQKHIQVDIYGACGTKKCPRSKSKDCFDMLNKDYKFYLAFENSNCRDYITEKFYVNGLGLSAFPGGSTQQEDENQPVGQVANLENIPVQLRLLDVATTSCESQSSQGQNELPPRHCNKTQHEVATVIPAIPASRNENRECDEKEGATTFVSLPEPSQPVIALGQCYPRPPARNYTIATSGSMPTGSVFGSSSPFSVLSQSDTYASLPQPFPSDTLYMGQGNRLPPQSNCLEPQGGNALPHAGLNRYGYHPKGRGYKKKRKQNSKKSKNATKGKQQSNKKSPKKALAGKGKSKLATKSACNASDMNNGLFKSLIKHMQKMFISGEKPSDSVSCSSFESVASDYGSKLHEKEIFSQDFLPAGLSEKYVPGKNCPKQVTENPRVLDDNRTLHGLVCHFLDLIEAPKLIGGVSGVYSDPRNSTTSSDSESPDSEETFSLKTLYARLMQEIRERQIQARYVQSQLDRKGKKPKGRKSKQGSQLKSKRKKESVQASEQSMTNPSCAPQLDSSEFFGTASDEKSPKATVEEEKMNLSESSNKEKSSTGSKSPNLLSEKIKPEELHDSTVPVLVDTHSLLVSEHIENSPQPEKEAAADENLVSFLRLGQVYRSYEDFLKDFSRYCAEHYIITRINGSRKTTDADIDKDAFPYTRVNFECIHAGSIHPRPHDKSRPNQSYYATNCSFRVFLSYMKKKKCYIIKRLVREHCGHKLSKSAYNQHVKKHKLTQAEIDKYIKKYVNELDVPTRTITEQIKKDTGKDVPGDRVRRYKHSLKVQVNEQAKVQGEMDAVLNMLRDEQKKDKGFIYKIVGCDASKQEFAPEGKKIVKAIFIQTSRMKKLFRKHGSLLLIDGTYNLTNKGYIVVPIHIVDNHLRTRLCAFSLLSNESAQVVQASLEQFKEANEQHIHNLRYVVADKDFNELAAVTKLFDNIEPVICSWHATRAVEKKIHETHLSTSEQHLKPLLKKKFKEMMHAPTAKDFFEKWNEIAATSLQHPSVEDLVEYIRTNWIQYKEHWAFYHLKHNQLYFSMTNNRSENFNKQLKQLIKRQSPMSHVIQQILKMSDIQAQGTHRKKVRARHQVLMPSNIANPISKTIMKEGQGWLSQSALKLLRKEGDAASKLHGPGLVSERGSAFCTQVSGKCSFWQNYKLPCQHLLATRWRLDENLLDKHAFDPQWVLSSSSSDEDSLTPQEDANMQETIPKELASFFVEKNETARSLKYTDFNSFLKEICSMMSHHSEKNRETMKKHIFQLVNAWNNDMDTKIITYKDKDGSCEKEGVFILSPKKEAKIQKTTTKSAKDQQLRKRSAKKNLFPDQPKSIPPPVLSSIVRTLKLLGSRRNMDAIDLEILDDQKRGQEAFLNDTIMYNFGILLSHQFSSLQNMQDTTSYTALEGFNRVDCSRPFVQIMHAGFQHWAVATNIGLSKEEMEKGQKVILFDSMIRLDSKHRPIVPPAILKQIAQLLKKPQNVKPMPIDIIVRPCQQQSDYYNCGMHSIINATSLAFGENPSNLVFETSEMRTQLLSMFDKGFLEMFKHERVSSKHQKGLFKVHAGGRLKSKIELSAKTTLTFLPICHCRLPKEMGNVIVCDQCNEEFHLSCSLMGAPQRGRSIASILKTWICFNCREAGQYNNGFLHQGQPDNDAIHIAEEGMRNLTYVDLCYAYNQVLDFNRPVPSSVREYKAVEEMIIKYDLHSILQETGVLFVAFKNFYNSFCEQLPSHLQFDELTKTHQLYFVLKLLCRMEGRTLHPITTHSEGADLTRPLADIMRETKNSYNELKKHLQYLRKELQTLKTLPPEHRTTRDRLSYISHEMDTLTDRIVSLQKQLQNSDDKGAAANQKSWKEEASLECRRTENELNLLKQDFEEYLCNQYK